MQLSKTEIYLKKKKSVLLLYIQSYLSSELNDNEQLRSAEVLVSIFKHLVIDVLVNHKHSQISLGTTSIVLLSVYQRLSPLFILATQARIFQIIRLCSGKLEEIREFHACEIFI